MRITTSLLASGVFTALLMPAGAVSAATVHVRAAAAPGGNGSGKAPFSTIAEAVEAANDLGGDTIKVAPGRYEITSPIRIEKPLKLRGSNEMLAGEDGWPTGDVMPGTETRLV